MIKKTVIEIDYRELEDLIKKTYGWNEYEFVAQEELQNDIAWTTTVDKAPLDEFQVDDLKIMKESGPHKKQWRTSMLMQDMCNNGILEAGDYVVEVSW